MLEFLENVFSKTSSLCLSDGFIVNFHKKNISFTAIDLHERLFIDEIFRDVNQAAIFTGGRSSHLRFCEQSNGEGVVTGKFKL